MKKSELLVGVEVRVKDSHKSRPLRGLEGVVANFYRQPSGWTAVRVNLQVLGLRTFQPTQLEVI